MPGIPDFGVTGNFKGGVGIQYIIINQESGATSFFQYMTPKGFWYIMRSVRTVAVTVYTYTAPVKTSAATGWTNRATLTYDTPNVVFVRGTP